MSILSLFGISNKAKEALRRGAVIIDVRTAHEFDSGKVKGSINIPLDRLDINIERIRSFKRPIVLCCSSGGRSEKAAGILKRYGVKDVYNGGSWTRVLRMLKSL
jgi:rhodanese-related sulfurtransferase